MSAAAMQLDPPRVDGEAPADYEPSLIEWT